MKQAEREEQIINCLKGKPIMLRNKLARELRISESTLKKYLARMRKNKRVFYQIVRNYHHLYVGTNR